MTPRFVNVHEVFKLCAILKLPSPLVLVENVNFLQNGNQDICTPPSARLFFKENFYGIDRSIFDIVRYDP